MRTQYVGTIPLDQDRLAKELEHSASFRYSEAYSSYLIGGPWKSCMLWSTAGDGGDGVVTNYAFDRAPTFTDAARELPYVQELITSVADLSRLTFVRLARITNSVIIPHRDLLELGEVPDDARPAHRVHIPLATNDACFFSEDNTVYRMRAGEVWYFDAARIHSVASFSDEPRVHLMLDFADRDGDGPLLTVPDQGSGPGIPADRTVARPPLSDGERADLMRLSDVLTMDTFNEVFGIVIKTHFRRDGGDHFVWQAMTEIARDSKDPDVLPHTLELHRYFTLERSA